jgi:hypothetical protein
MSVKRGHFESFYLIDADEYQTISELKSKCDELEKKLTEALKYKDLAATAHQSHLHAKIGSLQEELKKHKNQTVSSETFEPNSQEQVGSGFDNASFASSSLNGPFSLDLNVKPNDSSLNDSCLLSASTDVDYRKELVAAFEQFLKSQATAAHTNEKQSLLNSEPIVDQKGLGVTDDLTPVLPLPLASPDTNLTSQNEPIKLEVAARVPEVEDSTNTLSSVTERLISSVPSSSRPKAIQLLSQLKNHTQDFSFDQSGSIKINGKQIPNSNFFDIFPALYQRHQSKRPKDSALSMIVNELASLGLSHLIQRSFSAGLLPRGHKYLKDRETAKKSIPPNWYYLGLNND